MAHNLAADLGGRRLTDLSDYSAFPIEMSIATNYTAIHEVRTADVE